MTTDKAAYSLAAMGDAMLARNVGRHFVDKPQDFLLSGITSVLKNYNLVFLNLENPVALNGTPHHIQCPNVTFCSHPDTLQVLKNLGVTVVSLGNNHMLDYGEVALGETLECLDNYEIKHVGAGRNYDEANRPLLLEHNGKLVAFMSYVFIYSASTKMANGNKPGVSDHRIKKILPRIRDLKGKGYQVIISIHWGHEYSFYPIPYQMKQARQMIDNGASLILGHGPHYPQGIEEYKDGRIVYSMGNFIFDEPMKFANRSFVYGIEVTENDKLCGQCVYPFHIDEHLPILVEGKQKARLERLVHSLGKAYPGKSRKFWKKINNDYFTDIFGRVIRMKSLKFLFLPPVSFYFTIGVRNYLKKFSPVKLISFLKYVLKRISASLKGTIRVIIPLKYRKVLSIWLDKQRWLPLGDNLSVGILRDLQENDPKAFHKFLWSNHVIGYAKQYDSENLFDIENMQPSRLLFFDDIMSVIKELGYVKEKDISSVLEIGCSLGYLLRFIETDILPGVEELVGIDIDGDAVNKGKNYLTRVGSKARLVTGDMEVLDSLIGKSKFDLVFAGGVLSYLNYADASKVVSGMLQRTNKLLALIGLACTTMDNSNLTESIWSEDHNNQWIHNFKLMVESADGKIIKCRWEGARQFNYQTVYAVYAVPSIKGGHS